jgi:hypothetical protein
LTVELDPVCGVSRYLDLSGLGAKAGNHAADGTTLELRNHQYPVCRIFPDPEFVDGVAQHLFAGITVALLGLERNTFWNLSSEMRRASSDCIRAAWVWHRSFTRLSSSSP